MKDQFKLILDTEDNEDEWDCLFTSEDSVCVWVKKKYSDRFQMNIPYCSSALLVFLKELYSAEVVEGSNLFLNRNGLSLQVPMHHVYYTNSKSLCEWEKYLHGTSLRYFEYTFELQQLQNQILIIT